MGKKKKSRVPIQEEEEEQVETPTQSSTNPNSLYQVWFVSLCYSCSGNFCCLYICCSISHFISWFFCPKYRRGFFFVSFAKGRDGGLGFVYLRFEFSYNRDRCFRLVMCSCWCLSPNFRRRKWFVLKFLTLNLVRIGWFWGKSRVNWTT